MEIKEMLFSGIGDPVTASMVYSKALPPSKNGRGIRLKRPTFKLINPKMSQKNVLFS